MRKFISHRSFITAAALTLCCYATPSAASVTCQIVSDFVTFYVGQVKHFGDLKIKYLGDVNFDLKAPNFELRNVDFSGSVNKPKVFQICGQEITITYYGEDKNSISKDLRVSVF